MSRVTLSNDDIRRMARAIGLDRLTEEHVVQLTRAANTASLRSAALPVADLVLTDEPAHVFRLDSEGK